MLKNKGGKYLIIALSGCLIVLSCKNSVDNFGRKVYFDLSVGGSKANADKFYEKFREENNPDRISKYPFYKHKLPNGGNYYSSPLYIYPPNDTIVYKVYIYYFTNPKKGDDIIETTRQGLLSMTIDENYNGTSPQIVFTDILREVTSKYGKSDNSDTLTYKKPFHIINRWKDKDGINITLDYAYNTEYFQEPVNYYNLKLEFALTDELSSKLVKNKTIY